MAQNVLAVYPGTFDPITLGHEDVVRRATQLFERVIVAVAAGHHKKTLFSLEERIEMVREAVKDYPQVQVESFSGLLRDFVVSRGGKAMVRGLRAVQHARAVEAGAAGHPGLRVDAVPMSASFT